MQPMLPILRPDRLEGILPDFFSLVANLPFRAT
jgi:hypothetical protein